MESNDFVNPIGSDDPEPTDPKENPTGTGHLPVSGEAGSGPVPYHDPLTTDTNDDPDSAIDREDVQTVD